MAKFVPITGNEEENNSSQAPVQTQRDRSQEKQSQQERKTSSAKFVPFSEDQSLALSFGQQEFGEADISFSDRMSIAGGDNFAERRNIFLTRYPEGSFERVPGSGEEVFRRDPSESYRKFNPKGADLTDLAQITGEVRFPLLGEIAVNAPFMLTPQGAGASLSLAGTGVASLISKSIDGLKGAGIFSLKPGAREAIRASERLGVEAPLPGQTTRSKIINRLQGQTGQTTPVIQDSIDRTNASLAKAIEDMSILSNSERQNAVSSLSSALEDSRFTFINALSSGRNLPKEQFGQFIQDSRVKYAKESQRSVNEAYNLARSYEEPSFDVSGLQETAKILARQTKVKTRTRTGETVQEAIPDGVDEVRTIADQIKRADPDSVGVEQLQAWEQQLFDLSQPDVAGGRVTEVNRKARELRGAVRDTFNNPTNKGPEFKQAWNNARSAAKTRFQTLDDSFSVQIGKTDRPSQIVDKIMNPSTLTPRDVDLLRRVSTDEDFIEIQGSFVDRLLAEPDKITASLKAFDDEALEKLLSPSQRSQLADLGNRIDQLDTLNIAKAASRQERFAPFVRDLVASDKQTRRVGDLFRFVEENGGKEGSLGRIIRTGLVEELYKKTTERISGETGRNVRAKAFQRTLDDFDERGLLQFFERTELANLRDIFTVAEFSDIGGEGVAGLIGAQTVSEATKGSVGAIYNLIRNFGIGNVLVSKGGRRLIQGVGNNISRRDIIIPATNALGRILLEDAKLGEDEGLPSLEDVENFLSGQTEED